MAKLSSTHVYGDLYVDGAISGALSGNATTATTLQTARTINGTSFNGSANITTANWGTARDITIGSTKKSVNGSAAVSWTLSEIGAAAASHGTHVSYGGNGSASTVSRSDHTHSYLPLSGGTMTGKITTPNNSQGITIGDDIHLCDRNIADHLVLEGSTATNGGITFGSGKDTNIYRGGANLLKTDDTFNAVGGFQWNGTSLDNRYAAASHGTHLTIGTGASNAAAGNHTHNYAASSHNHGLLHDNHAVAISNTTTDSGWSMINSSYNGYILKSIRTNASAPNWICNNYAAGVAFGGEDTKGVLSCAYNAPSIKIAGGNGTKPVWWVGLTGTSGTTYDLNRINTAYNHSQAAHAPSNAQKNSDITKAEIEAKLTGAITSHTHNYAAASHGNHVPTTQTANNAVFLRNDNTWATVTPANIGAAASSHGTHLTIGTGASNAAAGNHTHNAITSRGNVTCESGVAGRPAVGGLSMSQAYNNGYPTTYGNVISLKGTGDGQILVGWSGTDGAHAPVYVRSKRDNTSTANWSNWAQFYTTANKPTPADIGAAASSHTHSYAASSHNHTSLTGVTSLAFATHSDDSASITTSVSGSSSYMDFNMSDDAGTDMWRWRFTAWDSSAGAAAATFNAMALVPTSPTKAQLQVKGDVVSNNGSNGGVWTNGGLIGLATSDGSAFQCVMRYDSTNSWAALDVGHSTLRGAIRIRSGQGTAGSGISILCAVTNGYNYVQWLSPEAGTIALTSHLSDRTRKNDVVYVGSENSEFTNKDFYNFIRDDLGLATYTLKEEYAATDTHTKINFIAQDLLWDMEKGEENKVGNLIVQAGRAMEEQGSLQYDPDNYVSVIAGALKESINKIEELEDKNKKLEERLAMLEEKFSALENK